MNRYYSSNRPEIQQLVNPKARRILDVGCGEGNLSFELKKRLNAECWGVEIYKPAFDEAVKKLDKVINLPIEEALNILPDKYFDTIICGDVLEHLINPKEVLIGLKDKLQDDGEVIISIPNVANWTVLYELLSGEFKYKDAGILDKTHLRFFTRKSFISMLEECNLKVEILKANYSNSFKEFIGKTKDFQSLNIPIEFFIQDADVEQFIIKAKKYLPSKVQVFNKTHSLDEFKIAISTINYKNANDTIEMIESLLSQDYKNVSIIVVDNSEDNNQILQIKDRYSNIEILDESDLNTFKLKFNKEIVLIKSSFNRGFSGGNNLAINLALNNLTDYIWILNNDTVVDSKTIYQLLYTLIITDSDVITCKIYDYYEKDKVQYDGYKIHIPPFKDFSDQIKSPVILSGANIFLKSQIFREVGLFDEDYFYYFEDNDFYHRLLKYGKKIIYTPFSHIYHKLGASVKTRNFMDNPFTLYYIVRNNFLFNVKNCKNVEKAKLDTFNLYKITFHNKKLLYSLITAVYDFKKGKFGKKEDMDFVKFAKNLQPKDNIDELYLSLMKNPRDEKTFLDFLNT